LGGFSDWTQVSAGWFHTLGVRSNGLAWSWGRNNSGQLADYTTVYRSSPVSLIGGITDWVQVAAGGYHSLGLRANGTARSWGNNSEGRLGDGTMTNRSNTVAVAGGFTNWVQLTAGFTTSMGIRSNGTAWAWGSNPYGRLGIGDTNYRVSPTSIVGGFTDWVQISAGNSHAAGLRTQPGRNRTG
jgi:alpha-tubulin suppressor-like RCC1 family protein